MSESPMAFNTSYMKAIIYSRRSHYRRMLLDYFVLFYFRFAPSLPNIINNLSLMETDTGALTFFRKRHYVLEMTQTRVSVKETMKQEWLNDLKLTDICVRYLC